MFRIEYRHLRVPVAVATVAMSLIACTDNRPRRDNFTTTPPTQVTSLVQVGVARFTNNNSSNQDTVVQQMTMHGTSLYVSGRPFAFARLETSPNPENPTVTFAASNTLGQSGGGFSPMGAWTADSYASGAIAIRGLEAFLSGALGLSKIDLSQISNPREVARKPPFTGQVPPPSDEAYIYRAIVAHPTLPLYYGFRQQDYVYTVDTSSNALNLVRRDAYGQEGQNVCCVTSATLFRDRIYVAFGNRLTLFEIASDGKLIPAGSYEGLHAAAVSSTANYLYVLHQPIPGLASAYAAGVYVFDAAGNFVDRIHSADRLLRMAVSSDDRYVYANTDNKSLKIFRIQWLQSLNLGN